MYHRMKSDIISQTLSDIFVDLEEDNEVEAGSLSQMDSSQNISTAISELLDPKRSFPDIREMTKEVNPTLKMRDFEATDHLTANDTAWNDTLNKTKTNDKKTHQDLKPKTKKKMTMKIEPSAIKPIRNPRKPLLRSMTSSNLNESSVGSIDLLPDLETILLEKSRSSLVPAVKKLKNVESDIRSSVDSGWLDRNTSSNSFDKEEISQAISGSSSFGLSNLNMKSFNSTSSLTLNSLNVEVKFDTLDHEIIGNSDDESETMRPLLHISKKRRLSTDQLTPTPSVKTSPIDKPIPPETPAKTLRNKAPEKPKRTSIRKLKAVCEVDEIKDKLTYDGDDSDRDPTYIEKLKEQPEASPPVMKRKRSVIKRSKEGISKITKKATKLLSRGKKARLVITGDFDPPKQEEEINFLIDSNLNEMTTVPRASQKELKTTEKLFDNYLKDNDMPSTSVKIKKVIDAKTAAKKEALEKKVASGSLNENFVRVNLKKKVFVRGKKAFSFSKYKKSVWKSKKAAALAGPEMDMRGCDGGVLRCHSCGGIGHFAQHCKQKGDNLLPVDAEIKDESPFPTLDEAAQMASNQKLLVHTRKPDQIPAKSNEAWKSLNENSEDEGRQNYADKENKDQNSESNDAAPAPLKVNLITIITQLLIIPGLEFG